MLVANDIPYDAILVMMTKMTTQKHTNMVNFEYNFTIFKRVYYKMAKQFGHFVDQHPPTPESGKAQK